MWYLWYLIFEHAWSPSILIKLNTDWVRLSVDRWGWLASLNVISSISQSNVSMHLTGLTLTNHNETWMGELSIRNMLKEAFFYLPFVYLMFVNLRPHSPDKAWGKILHGGWLQVVDPQIWKLSSWPDPKPWNIIPCPPVLLLVCSIWSDKSISLCMGSLHTSLIHCLKFQHQPTQNTFPGPWCWSNYFNNFNTVLYKSGRPQFPVKMAIR